MVTSNPNKLPTPEDSRSEIEKQIYLERNSFLPVGPNDGMNANELYRMQIAQSTIQMKEMPTSETPMPNLQNKYFDDDKTDKHSTEVNECD